MFKRQLHVAKWKFSKKCPLWKITFNVHFCPIPFLILLIFKKRFWSLIIYGKLAKKRREKFLFSIFSMEFETLSWKWKKIENLNFHVFFFSLKVWWWVMTYKQFVPAFPIIFTWAPIHGWNFKEAEAEYKHQTESSGYQILSHILLVESLNYVVCSRWAVV